MEELYRKLAVNQFASIQEQLRKFVISSKLIRSSTRHYAHNVSYLAFSQLASFVNSRLRCTVPWSKFYLTPPNFRWGPHVDGTTAAMNRVCLNVPVLNCENSLTLWNRVEPEDYKVGAYGHDGGLNTLVKPGKDYPVIDQMTLDRITIMRTDLFHDVINLDKERTRVNFVIRLGPVEDLALAPRPLDHYFNLTDL